MDWKNKFTKTPFLVLFIVLISVGVGTAFAINITLGGTVDITQTLNMMGNKITNVGTPTASTDATTKAYVDTAAVLMPNVYQNFNVHPVSGLGFVETLAFCDQGDTLIGGGVNTFNAMRISDSFPSEEEGIEGWVAGVWNLDVDEHNIHVFAICLDDALPAHVP